ncbi:MAG: hypothetical protein MJZ49_05175 [Bacteroidales bacterium]|nr:hypothetical protein [Bacteroidales bacterium]
MGILQDLNIVRGNGLSAATIFESLFQKDFTEFSQMKPSEYVNMYWEAYQKRETNNQNINGKIFEYIISTLLYNEKLLPLYIQAQVAFVPNVDFDALLYCDEVGPIALSMKTSLRERYKQADLEAIALKYVHRRAKSYLLTMSESEAVNVKEKIKSGDVIGLDDIVVCSTSEIDDFISSLKKYDFKEAGEISIIKSTQIVKL